MVSLEVIKNYLKLFRSLALSHLALNKMRVSYIGDSHSRVLSSLTNKEYCFYGVSISGATASGLGNPNSKTKAWSFFKLFANLDIKSDVVVVQLGEVDVGFVIWYKEKFKGVKIHDGLMSAIDGYFKLIKYLKKRYKHVVVISSPLPTIPDGVAHGEVANLRSVVESSQKDRTELTLRFNSEIEGRVLQLEGVYYLNLDGDSVCTNTGLVNRSLVSLDVSDHHYDVKSYLSIIEKKLYDRIANILE